jgi:hypothetical protein
MGSDGRFAPISFWPGPLLKAAYPDAHPFGRISNDKSAYRKSPSQAVMRDREQIVNAKSNIVLRGLAVLSLLRNPSGGCKRKAHRECSSRDGCNQPHP